MVCRSTNRGAATAKTNGGIKMKAWLYYRLSRDEDAEMNSLQNQRQILVDYAEQNGYEITGESFDDNVSGMTFERKGLHQIELAVEDGKVDVLLVKDLSRLGRHRTRTALFIDYLRENNVRVYSVTEGIDSSNENDDMIIGFKQLVNDFYAKDIGKKVRAGIRQKQKTGMPVNLPMGYYKDKFTGEILVDETAAAIVREIFEKFFEGYGLSTIAKEFNRRGIKSPEYFSHRKVGAQRTQMCKKFLWVQTTVKRIIQNEAYTGTLVNHKTVTSKIYKTVDVIPPEEQYRHENFMPAIIDKETFVQAQILLESRLKNHARAKFGSVIHRYCGMIKCAECGASLIAKKRTVAGHSWVEYTCNSNHRYGNEYCTAHTIREPQLDEIIHTELAMLRQEILDSSQKYDEIVREWNKKKPKYDKMIKEYSQMIVSLNGQIEELIMERIGDREHAKVYNSMIEKREAEIAELTQKIEECRKFDELSKKRRDELMSTAELLDEVLLEPYVSDANMRLLVRKINVHENEDGSLDVNLEFNGDFKDTSTGCFEIND